MQRAVLPPAWEHTTKCPDRHSHHTDQEALQGLPMLLDSGNVPIGRSRCRPIGTLPVEATTTIRSLFRSRTINTVHSLPSLRPLGQRTLRQQWPYKTVPFPHKAMWLGSSLSPTTELMGKRLWGSWLPCGGSRGKGMEMRWWPRGDSGWQETIHQFSSCSARFLSRPC